MTQTHVQTPQKKPEEKLAALRQQLAGRLAGQPSAGGATLPLGLSSIDRHLGGGLAQAALHEVAGSGSDAELAILPAFFASQLIRRHPDRRVLWVASTPDLYGPGLHGLGIDPARLLLAETRQDADSLWVLEEAARSGAVSLVIGEIDSLDLTERFAVITGGDTFAFRKPDGTMGERRFTVFRTHHGPIVGEANDRWLAEALMWKPIPALEQSWLRTKASDLASYLKVAELKANSSNDTLFADTKGEIAYLHPQFVPIRDDRFDYTRPVDGSNPATDWHGLHALDSLPKAINPAVGWAKNTNNWPWTAAGPDSPKAEDFPRYMDQAGENERGVHSDMLMKDNHDFTPASLTRTAFDSYLPAFATLIPQLTAAYDALPAGDPARKKLAGPVASLKRWNYRWGYTSEPTSLAVFWGDALWNEVGTFAQAERMNVSVYIAERVSPA